MKKIVIVGGGITGLSAAYYLNKAINENDLPYKIKLVEASERLGGKIKTVRRDGFTIERGPDSFLARKQSAVELIKELGLEKNLIRNATGQAYVLVGKKLHKIPQGFFMGVPMSIRPLLFSSLFSPKGKARAMMDLILSKGKEVDDQELGSFFRRRFGNELVDYLIEPLLSGIYSGDIDKMSLMATFPNFYHLEQKYGSLIKGLQNVMPKPNRKDNKKKEGAFYALNSGFESLVEAFKRHLPQEMMMIGCAVDHIEKKESYYHLLLSDGTVEKADAIVITTPHQTLPKMFSQYRFLDTLEDMPSTSVANVALAFNEKDVKNSVNGTGFVISRKSNYRMTACTWTDKKWPGTAPDGKVLLRSYVGRPDDQEVVHLSDDEIVQIVLHDLKKSKTIKIKGDPLFSVITRFKNVMPQYTVGHVERINNIREKLNSELQGVFIAGSSYEGVGVPDCIDQGKKAVEEVMTYLND